MTEWLGLGGVRVLIAGGAGTIGAALVDGFAEAGAAVAVVDVDRARLDALGAHVTIRLTADLRDPSASRDAVDSAREGLGGLDVFVHCAGINIRRPIEDYSDQEWDDIVAVNLSSAFHMARAVAPVMREQARGRIVMFSSVAGRSGHRHHGPYAATKAAINQLVRVMAHEYAEHGVTVNAVAPGYMDTALTEAYLAEHPDKREALIRLIPAARFGTLDELVGPVMFLASRHASFITGQVIYLDGGRTVI